MPEQMPGREQSNDNQLGRQIYDPVVHAADFGNSVWTEAIAHGPDYFALRFITKGWVFSLKVANHILHQDLSTPAGQALSKAAVETAASETVASGISHLAGRAIGTPAWLAFEALCLFGSIIRPYENFYLQEIPNDMARRFQIPDVSGISHEGKRELAHILLSCDAEDAISDYKANSAYVPASIKAADGKSLIESYLTLDKAAHFIGYLSQIASSCEMEYCLRSKNNKFSTKKIDEFKNDNNQEKIKNDLMEYKTAIASGNSNNIFPTPQPIEKNIAPEEDVSPEEINALIHSTIIQNDCAAAALDLYKNTNQTPYWQNFSSALSNHVLPIVTCANILADAFYSWEQIKQSRQDFCAYRNSLVAQDENTLHASKHRLFLANYQPLSLPLLRQQIYADCCYSTFEHMGNQNKRMARIGDQISQSIKSNENIISSFDKLSTAAEKHEAKMLYHLAKIRKTQAKSGPKTLAIGFAAAGSLITDPIMGGIISIGSLFFYGSQSRKLKKAQNEIQKHQRAFESNSRALDNLADHTENLRQDYNANILLKNSLVSTLLAEFHDHDPDKVLQKAKEALDSKKVDLENIDNDIAKLADERQKLEDENKAKDEDINYRNMKIASNAKDKQKHIDERDKSQDIKNENETKIIAIDRVKGLLGRQREREKNQYDEDKDSIEKQEKIRYITRARWDTLNKLAESNALNDDQRMMLQGFCDIQNIIDQSYLPYESVAQSIGLLGQELQVRGYGNFVTYATVATATLESFKYSQILYNGFFEFVNRTLNEATATSDKDAWAIVQGFLSVPLILTGFQPVFGIALSLLRLYNCFTPIDQIAALYADPRFNIETAYIKLLSEKLDQHTVYFKKILTRIDEINSSVQSIRSQLNMLGIEKLQDQVEQKSHNSFISHINDTLRFVKEKTFDYVNFFAFRKINRFGKYSRKMVRLLERLASSAEDAAKEDLNGILEIKSQPSGLNLARYHLDYIGYLTSKKIPNLRLLYSILYISINASRYFEHYYQFCSSSIGLSGFYELTRGYFSRIDAMTNLVAQLYNKMNQDWFVKMVKDLHGKYRDFIEILQEKHEYHANQYLHIAKRRLALIEQRPNTINVEQFKLKKPVGADKFYLSEILLAPLHSVCDFSAVSDAVSSPGVIETAIQMPSLVLTTGIVAGLLEGVSVFSSIGFMAAMTGPVLLPISLFLPAINYCMSPARSNDNLVTILSTANFEVMDKTHPHCLLLYINLVNNKLNYRRFGALEEAKNSNIVSPLQIVEDKNGIKQVFLLDKSVTLDKLKQAKPPVSSLFGPNKIGDYSRYKNDYNKTMIDYMEAYFHILESNCQKSGEVEKLRDDSVVNVMKKLSLKSKQKNYQNQYSEQFNSKINDGELIFPEDEALLPLYFPKKFLQDLRGNYWLRPLFEAEQLGMGKVNCHYSFAKAEVKDNNDEVGFYELVLSYNLIMEGEDGFSYLPCLKLIIAKFDVVTVESFSKLTLKDDGKKYEFEVNYNEFLILAHYGSPSNAPVCVGLPGDDTVDLTGQGKGSICPVEVSFPGLFSILKQLPKGRMFEYSHKKYNGKWSAALFSFSHGERCDLLPFFMPEMQLPAETSEYSLIKSRVFHELRLRSLQAFKEAVYAKDGYQDQFEAYVQQYEIFVSQVKLFANFDYATIAFLLKENLGIPHPFYCKQLIANASQNIANLFSLPNESIDEVAKEFFNLLAMIPSRFKLAMQAQLADFKMIMNNRIEKQNWQQPIGQPKPEKISEWQYDDDTQEKFLKEISALFVSSIEMEEEASFENTTVAPSGNFSYRSNCNYMPTLFPSPRQQINRQLGHESLDNCNLSDSPVLN